MIIHFRWHLAEINLFIKNEELVENREQLKRVLNNLQDAVLIVSSQ